MLRLTMVDTMVDTADTAVDTDTVDTDTAVDTDMVMVVKYYG